MRGRRRAKAHGGSPPSSACTGWTFTAGVCIASIQAPASIAYVVSTSPTVWVCDYDIERGTVDSSRLFVTTHELPGRPDGGCVDTEGGYWMAAIDGGCVLRFEPDGKLVGSVSVPVEKPSKAAFGGLDLDRMFITSLRRNLSTPLESQPHAGRLFVARLGVRGVAVPDCAITLQSERISRG